MTPKPLTRRRFGLGVATLSSIAVAGCFGDGDDHADDDHGNHGDDDDHDNYDDHDDDRSHNDDNDDHDSDTLVSDVDVIDRGEDEVVANYHGHWHGGLPAIHRGEHLSLGARFKDAGGDQISIGDDDEYQLYAEISGSDNDVISIEPHGDHIHLHGESEGETDVVFQLVSNDTVEWETAEGISVRVVDE